MSAYREIYLLFALEEERKAFSKRMPSIKAAPKDAIHATVTGVGATKAAQIAESIIERCDLLFICGFCGGLSEATKPGSLIFADKVTTEKETFLPDAALLKMAESVRAPNAKVKCGTLVTVNKVATTAAEKRELAERTGAIAVDMETAGAVRVAQERGIPWLAVRAITDGVNDELPLDFNALANPDGSVNRGRVIRATLAKPHKIPALIRLGQRSSLAANNLAAFLVAFLQTLPETE